MIKRCAGVCLASLALLLSVLSPSVANADTADAVDWLLTQQQADGGFEVAGFPGFETADAVMAIAEGAQTSSEWDPSAAVAAVEAAVTGGNTALDAIDVEAADATLTPGAAAKIIALVAAPLGLDPAAFDPAGDGDPVDLLAIVTDSFDEDTGLFGDFTGTMFGAIVHPYVCAEVPSAVASALEDAQNSLGGWDFSGDSTSDSFDPDTTGRALQALAAAGFEVDDAVVADAITLIASEYDGSAGGWASFGQVNPNSTSMVILGLAAFGIDTTTADWRDAAAPATIGDSYIDPDVYLVGEQEPDGRVASPSDSFGINTFATSQSIQALSRVFDVTAAGPDCEPVVTTTVPPSTTAAPSTTMAPSTTAAPTTVAAASAATNSSTAARSTQATIARTGNEHKDLLGLAGLFLAAGSCLVMLGVRRSHQ